MIVIDMLQPAHFHVCISIFMYFPELMKECKVFLTYSLIEYHFCSYFLLGAASSHFFGMCIATIMLATIIIYICYTIDLLWAKGGLRSNVLTILHTLPSTPLIFLACYQWIVSDNSSNVLFLHFLLCTAL
jgi:hypothetical protein